MSAERPGLYDDPDYPNRDPTNDEVVTAILDRLASLQRAYRERDEQRHRKAQPVRCEQCQHGLHGMCVRPCLCASDRHGIPRR